MISPAAVRAGAGAQWLSWDCPKRRPMKTWPWPPIFRRKAHASSAPTRTCFSQRDWTLPGAGALLASIETSTGVAPFVIGKPEPIMFLEAVHRLGGDPESVAMIGDRLSTDIAGGQQRQAARTILVLSGISTSRRSGTGRH